MFNGNNGRTAYDAANGVFGEVNSIADPTTGLNAVPFKYADEADFAKKVDLSVAGQMMDCAECHVGGGGMQYIPNPDLSARVALRDIATTNVPGYGGTVGGAPIPEGDYTAFNYFIDTYDADGDGEVNEVLYMDYAKTGVMEMDCFMCHLPGYDYNARNEALRDGKLDATRAVGAGIAEATDLAWGAEGYGTTVNYDDTIIVADEVTGELEIPGDWMGENLSGVPDSSNCANCHFNEFSVDWKKRGDHWEPDHQYEVHYSFGCMGCHERTDDLPAATASISAYSGNPEVWRRDSTDPLYSGNYAQQGSGALGHDPAKGKYAQYSGLYNINDDAAFKDCGDCHGGDTGESSNLGAPNPANAHAAAGLTAAIVQNAAMTGTVSHLDIMHCSACHSRKIDSTGWSNTGAPLIDATGKDTEGRLTDHENDYVIKEDMTDNTGLSWYKGKLRRVTSSATMFWRDKNDFPPSGAAVEGNDANFDGRPNGMDALLMTDVLAVNKANGWTSITEDNHGAVYPADFAERITAFNTYIDTKAGSTVGTAKTKFAIFHVNFMNQHAVSPAAEAFGAGGCADCHDAGAEFWNGSVDTTGDNNTMYYGTSTTQRVPFTKVNGFGEPSDFHPGTLDRFAARSIAIQVSTVATTCDWDGDDTDPADDVACMTTRPVDRAETMYETTFKTAADYATEFQSSAPIVLTGWEKGWHLVVQVKEIATDTVTTRTKMIGGDIAPEDGDPLTLTDGIPALLTGLGGTFTGGTFNFTVTGIDMDNADADGDETTGTLEGVKFEAAAGYEIRLTNNNANAADFKLIHAQFKDQPWTGLDGNSYAGRTAWVGYLNGITAASVGIGVDPIAVIDTFASDLTATAGETVNLVADTTVNTSGTFSYSWEIFDGSGTVASGDDVTVTVNTAGTYGVVLTVTDEEGKKATANTSISVTPALPPSDFTYNDNDPLDDTVSIAGLLPHTMLYIRWGDGTISRVTTTLSEVPKTYASGTYNVLVYVYNGRARVQYKTGTITVP
ncbi:MAG: hypothetical protein C0622_02220 [Desulfuromonas sp.]|nr:MAG: hypothetical protein C0622_02220 [Desulfuromonas sp.]